MLILKKNNKDLVYNLSRKKNLENTFYAFSQECIIIFNVWKIVPKPWLNIQKLWSTAITWILR